MVWCSQTESFPRGTPSAGTVASGSEPQAARRPAAVVSAAAPSRRRRVIMVMLNLRKAALRRRCGGAAPGSGEGGYWPIRAFLASLSSTENTAKSPRAWRMVYSSAAPLSVLVLRAVASKAAAIGTRSSSASR